MSAPDPAVEQAAQVAIERLTESLGGRLEHDVADVTAVHVNVGDLRTVLNLLATTQGAGAAPCGQSDEHGPHPMPCDSGCQPDWHRDGCAIYGTCPGTTQSETVWLCAKCGHGSEEHGMAGHRAFECVADMRLVPAAFCREPVDQQAEPE